MEMNCDQPVVDRVLGPSRHSPLPTLPAMELDANSPLLPEGLLDIMQCPDCTGRLDEDVAASQLVCRDCQIRYPVNDGIPVMLLDQAIRPEAAD